MQETRISRERVDYVPTQTMYYWMSSNLKNAAPSQLVPFYLDDSNNLRAVTTITVPEPGGKIAERLHTGLYNRVPDSVAMAMRLQSDTEVR